VYLKSEPSMEAIRLMAVGDIMLSENHVTGEMIKLYGPEYPFEKISKYLNQADLAYERII
jgi:hypothetical protein